LKIRAIDILLFMVILMILTSCGQLSEELTPTAGQPTQQQPTSQSTPTPVPQTLSTPVDLQGRRFPPPQGTSTPFPTPSAQALQKQVELAKQDLAGRLSISVDEIVLTDFREITWPDSSLGCPQPDMAYSQVIVDGVSIQLQANDLVYNYHGDGIQPPFLCERVGPVGPMEPPKNK
jgi:hypothetical protein